MSQSGGTIVPCLLEGQGMFEARIGWYSPGRAGGWRRWIADYYSLSLIVGWGNSGAVEPDWA
jgi:hypothetical protein